MEKEKNIEEKRGFFSSLSALFKSEAEKRRTDRSALLFDICVFTVAFLFSRCHLIFGAYSLGHAFVAFMNRGVFTALLGCVIGSLSLGRVGVINAIISVIVVFLRVIISGGDGEEHTLFKEPLIVRISSGAIGSFIGGIYGVLLESFAIKSILLGVCGVLLTVLFTFVFSGILNTDISFSDFVSGKRDIFLSKGDGRARTDKIFFEVAFFTFVFLFSLSLKSYNLLGINPSYIFSSLITLFIAKRFGVWRATVAGFVSSLGISGIYSVSFALLGLGAGVFFHLGTGYALIAGGALLSLWSAYSGGLVGVLATLPEYLVSAVLSLPILKKTEAVKRVERGSESGDSAKDMVTATALAYRVGIFSESADGAEALSSISREIRNFCSRDERKPYESYLECVTKCVSSFCKECTLYLACTTESPAPCAEKIESMTTKVYTKGRISGADASAFPAYCKNTEELSQRINSEICAFIEGNKRGACAHALAEGYELASRVLSEGRLARESETYLDQELTDKLSEVLARHGIQGSSIRIIGERKKHIIAAGLDPDGTLITTKELISDIEEIAGHKLLRREFYRRGEYALFEADFAPKFSYEFATVSRCSSRESVCGDLSQSRVTSDGHAYFGIFDGAGSGEGARRTASFSADFILALLDASATKSTAIHALNHAIKENGEEESVALDLFDFDLYTGEAVFYKCGAAPSYVKRDGSLFRITSKTAPLGLMRGIDAEKVRVEVRAGDYVIMLSDGACNLKEGGVRLIEMLSARARASLSEYAEHILEEIEGLSSMNDDITVSVIKIKEASES